MCGIGGVFHFRSAEPGEREERLRAAGDALAAALARRGPDDTGVFLDAAEGTLLVQRRLSILDLSPAGHQPMFDDSGRFGIVFNGEVYNFAELKSELQTAGHAFRSHCDTEVILHAYMQWGAEALPRLRGMFAFVILDRSGAAPVLFCARDRFGIKPLVYGGREVAAAYRAGGADGAAEREFFFASECGALTAAGLVPKKIRAGALWEYCRTGAVLQPGTVYEGLRQLRPGHYLEVSAAGTAREVCWYDLAAATVRLRGELAGQNFSYLTGLTRVRLEEAAKYHAIADVPVGAFLSGGIDSAAVAGLLAGQTSGPLKAFTIGFESQAEVPDEIAAARESADFLRADHYAVTIRDAEAADAFDDFIATLDQPSMDGFNTYLVSRAAAGAVKVALSGLGGDELFAGYPHFADIEAAQGKTMPAGVRELLRLAHALRPNRLTRRWLYRGVGAAEAARTFRDYLPAEAVARILRVSATDSGWHDAFCAGGGCAESALPVLAQITRQELSGYLLSTLLRDCDVCSMAHSLEVRPILLDHVLVEHAFALPDEAKIRDGRGKAALSEAMAGLISPACRTRRKTGFEIPFGRWLAGGLKERFRALLEGGMARTLLVPAYRRRIAQDLNAADTARRHWRWLALLAWLEQSGASL